MAETITVSFPTGGSLFTTSLQGGILSTEFAPTLVWGTQTITTGQALGVTSVLGLGLFMSSTGDPDFDEMVDLSNELNVIGDFFQENGIPKTHPKVSDSLEDVMKNHHNDKFRRLANDLLQRAKELEERILELARRLSGPDGPAI